MRLPLSPAAMRASGVLFAFRRTLLGVFYDGVGRHGINPGAELARAGVLRDQLREGRVRGGFIIVAALRKLYTAVGPLDCLPRRARLVLHA